MDTTGQETFASHLIGWLFCVVLVVECLSVAAMSYHMMHLPFLYWSLYPLPAAVVAAPPGAKLLGNLRGQAFTYWERALIVVIFLATFPILVSAQRI